MGENPEPIAMARRIAADVARAQGFATRPQMFLDGRWDNHASVQTALAAIIETRKEMIRSLRHDFDDWPDYVALADVADTMEERYEDERHD